MKRGVSIVVLVSLVLILSSSIVSADTFFEGVLKALFGSVPGPIPTGHVTGGTGATCSDIDGPDNFLVASKVVKDSIDYVDFCSGDVAYDFYCTDTGDAPAGGIAVFLPFSPSITGAVVGDPNSADAPPKTSVNCQSVYGVPCNAGRCGCVDGTTKTCGPTEGNVGQCKLGTATCSSGTYGSCVGAVYATTETCDSIDNDCDGSIDEGLTCGDNAISPCNNNDICEAGIGETQYNCNDCATQIGEPGECTSGSTRACGTDIGECVTGTQTCVGGFWGSCSGNYVSAATEICSDMLDNDCDGSPSTLNINIQSCTDSDCNGQTCGTNKICSSGVCLSVPQCTDLDSDGYDSCDIGQGDSYQKDCNDNNASISPGKAEICGNTVDENCDGTIINPCPTTCTDTDGDHYNTTTGGVCGSVADCNDGNINVWRTGSFYPDKDHDGRFYSNLESVCYGSSTPTWYSSSSPGSNADCNDNNINLYQYLMGYADGDGDGAYSNTGQNVCSGVSLPSGYSSTQGNDCNDGVASIKAPTNFYPDSDGDGYADSSKTPTSACSAPSGYSSATGDCNDEDNTIYPSATELCDGKDNNCVNSVDEGSVCASVDYYCDNDGDGEISSVKSGTCASLNCKPAACELGSGTDCDDANTVQGKAKNTKANETCDNVDNDCDGTADDNIQNKLKCLNEDTGKSVEVFSVCSAGAFNFNDCVGAGYLACGTKEVCGDKLDNNCDGSIDENCDCTEGETSACNTDNPCEVGQQKCENGKTTSCAAISTKVDCNPDEACVPETVDLCGSNNGICFKGQTTCGINGTWGSCVDEIKPQTEICLDKLDNDCDGTTDELSCTSAIDAKNADDLQNYQDGLAENVNGEIDTTADVNENGIPDYLETQQGTGSGTESGASSGTGSKTDSGIIAFLKKIFGFITMIFRVGHFLGQPILEDVSGQAYCTDSDLGKNYFLAGTGEGLNQQKTQLWFGDFCYEGDQNNKVDKCAGSNCFLKEYYCDLEYIASEPAVSCSFGCINGACVPDASLNTNCQYFDKEQWKIVNIC